MELNLKFGSALCYTPTFVINGIEADQRDFGEQHDRNPEFAEPYGCGNMRFTRNESSPEVLAKYGITQGEYDDISAQLEVGLSFGSCGLCI